MLVHSMMASSPLLMQHSPSLSSSSSTGSPANSPASTTVSAYRLPPSRVARGGGATATVVADRSGSRRQGAGLHTLADAAEQSVQLALTQHRHQRHQQQNSSPGGPQRTSVTPPVVGRGAPTASSPSAASSSARSPSFEATVSPSAGAGPTAGNLGPLTQQILLPPRKQPGRKRATEEPVDKRTAQNRTAQRAYRERRAQIEEEQRQRLNELENETVPQLTAKIAHYEPQFTKDQDRIRALMEELERERSAAATAATATKSTSAAGKIPHISVLHGHN
jgi:hypothetical protein